MAQIDPVQACRHYAALPLDVGPGDQVLSRLPSDPDAVRIMWDREKAGIRLKRQRLSA